MSLQDSLWSFTNPILSKNVIFRKCIDYSSNMQKIQKNVNNYKQKNNMNDFIVVEK